MKAFMESQFNYCPLIVIFHSRTLNNKINRLYERALRIVYSDYKSLFCELLEIDKWFPVLHKNIQSLAIEIYKFLHNLYPCIINNIVNHLALWIFHYEQHRQSNYPLWYRDLIYRSSQNMTTCTRYNQKLR